MISFSEIVDDTIERKLNWPQIPNYPFNTLNIACISHSPLKLFSNYEDIDMMDILIKDNKEKVISIV